MKHLFKNLFKATLLLLIVCTLGVGIVAIASADTTASCSITFAPYGTGCQGVYVSVAGGTEQKIGPEGGTLPVPGGVSVMIRLDIHAGYSHVMTDENSYETTTVTWNQIVNTNKTFSVVCTPKTFDIHYLERETYNLSAPATHTYGSKTMIENHPQKTGYNFLGWYQVDDAEGNNPRKLELNPEGILVLDENFATSDIYLKPLFEKIKYDVTRYDAVYNPQTPSGQGGKPLGNVTFRYDVAESVDGRNGDDVNPGIYRGYTFLRDESKYYSPSIIVAVTHNEEGELIATNEVYRFYLPVVYTLQYFDDNGEALEGYTGPQSYTYTSPTAIPDPTRSGYTFLGWTVTVTVEEEEKTYNVDAGFALGTGNDGEDVRYTDDNEVIRLTARWQPNVYGIEYVFGNIKEESDLTHNATLPASFTFDSLNGAGEKLLSVPNPKRAGYTFLGWTLVGLDAEGNPIPDTEVTFTDALPLSLNTGAYPYDVRLSAQWTPKTYGVNLNGNGATKPGTASISGVVFDGPLTLPEPFTVPERNGFTFAGYWSTKDEGGVQYIDGEGKSVCTAWDLFNDDGNGNVTLYARWTRNQYKVTVNVTGIPAGVSGLQIVLREQSGTEHPYTGTPIELPYETKFTVLIKSPAGYKTVKWNGTTLAEHKPTFTSDTVTLGYEDLTLNASVLKMIEVPTVTINYIDECFRLPNGVYRIYLDTTVLNVTVNTGSIIVNGLATDKVSIPEAFFGKTVQLICFGDGTATSDSDAVPISVVARPEAPKTPAEVESIDNTVDTEITVNMKDGLPAIYEFAVSAGSDLSDLVWSDSNVITGLNPGTTYTIYVRVKATADAPHGEAYVTPLRTPAVSYVPEKIKELEDLLKEDDGSITGALVADAIQRIEELDVEKPSTFYDDVEKIVADVKAKLTFARLQDSKIEALKKLLEDNLNTGSFATADSGKLNDICAAAVAGITAATAAEDVNDIYENAVRDMSDVPVTFLYDINQIIKLISEKGLMQGGNLSFVRFTDFQTLSNAVDAAIRTPGRVAVGSFMTREEAEQLLRTLDVVAAYHFDLKGTPIADGEQFTFRLQIPAEFEGKTGLQVAYYDETSGTLELLETEVNGNELVFRANRVADFVILADPTLELTVMIAVLGVILLFQLIAVIMILVSRSKSGKGKGVAHASVALPAVMLAIRMSPANAPLILLIMGIAVVLMQVLIMYLLLSSDMIRRKGKGAPAPKQEKKSRAQQQMEEEAAVANAAYSTVVPPIAAGAAAVSDSEEDPFAVYNEEQAAEAPLAEATDAEDENDYGDLWYADEEIPANGTDFIEPAANPRYSLPEEGEELAVFDETADAALEETDESDAEAAYATEEYATEEYATEEYATEEYAAEEYAAEEYAAEEYAAEAYAAAEYAAADDIAEDYDGEEYTEADTATFAYDDGSEELYAAEGEADYGEEYSAGEYLQDAQSYEEDFDQEDPDALNREFYEEGYEEGEMLLQDEEDAADESQEDADADDEDAEANDLYRYDE